MFGRIRHVKFHVQSFPRNAGFLRPFRSSATTVTPKIAHCEVLAKQQAVQIEWEEGGHSTFHQRWLRDHCLCPSCKHPDTKQRLLDTASIPSNLQVTHLVSDKDHIKIQWNEPVGDNPCMESEFKASWLREHAYSHRSYSQTHHQHALYQKKLWGHELKIPEMEYDEFMTDSAKMKTALAQLNTYGLLLIQHSPLEMEATEKFARKIGFVLETIYGRMWTTNPTSEEQSYNDTASTNYKLMHHTDGTYMRDPPGLQIFTCTQQAHSGGDSMYVDAFKVAEILRSEAPKAFKFFSQVPLPYESFDEDSYLQTYEPLLRLDHMGEIIQFRHNDYDRAPLTHLSYEEVGLFYEYQKQLLEIIRRPELQLNAILQKGQTIVVDNQRVMHGRNGFQGARSLIGCYIGRTEYDSRLRMLGIF